MDMRGRKGRSYVCACVEREGSESAEHARGEDGSGITHLHSSEGLAEVAQDEPRAARSAPGAASQRWATSPLSRMCQVWGTGRGRVGGRGKGEGGGDPSRMRRAEKLEALHGGNALRNFFKKFFKKVVTT